MEKAHPTRWAFFMGEALPALCASKQAKTPTSKKGPAGPLCHLYAHCHQWRPKGHQGLSLSWMSTRVC